MSEQAEKTRKVRAKRRSEGEAREVLRDWRESGLSAVAFAAQRRLSSTRLLYWEARLGQSSADDLSFVAVPLSSPRTMEVEHRGVTVRLGTMSMDELAQLVVEIARRANRC